MVNYLSVSLATLSGVVVSALLAITLPSIIPSANSTAIASGLLLFPFFWLALVWQAVTVERYGWLWFTQGVAAGLSVLVIALKLGGGAA